MLELLRKDLIATRWFLLPGLALYVAQLASMSSAPPIAGLTAVGFTLLLIFGPLGVDEAQQTEALWNSLPISRAQVVFARYAQALGAAGVGLGIYQFIVSPPPALNLLLLAWLLLQISLFLPCYFRLGLGRGLIAFLVLTLALSVLGSGLGMLLAYRFDPPLTVDGAQAPGTADAVRTAIDGIGLPLALGLLAVLVPLFAGSALFAVLFYRRRDL